MAWMEVFGSDRMGRLPELFLVFGISGLLVAGSVMGTSSVAVNMSSLPVMGFVMHRRVAVMRALAFMMVMNSASYVDVGGWTSNVLNGTLNVDAGTQMAKARLRGASVLCLVGSTGHAIRLGLYAFEYPILIALATLGLMIMVSANDLIVRYLGLEWQSLCLYVLAAFRRGSAYSTEAGLKYFIMGSVASGFYLFGSSLIYGATGSVNFSDIGRRRMGDAELGVVDAMGAIGLALVLSAFMFKLAVAPFHAWSPDVYEGSPLPSTLYFAVVPKLAMVVVVARLCFGPFAELFAVAQPIRLMGSALSRLVAALSALVQRRLKRFRAYSAIGHMGYVFLALASGSFEGVQAAMIYLVMYILMSLGAWLSVMSLSRRVPSTSGDSVGEMNVQSAKYITDLGGLGRVNPFLGMVLAMSVRSMAGIPPLAGFMAKMWVFFSAMSQSLIGFSVLGVLTSCVGAFYYRRFVKVMYFEGVNSQTASSFSLGVDRGASYVMGFAVGLIAVMMAIPGPVMVITHRMALSICS